MMGMRTCVSRKTQHEVSLEDQRWDDLDSLEYRDQRKADQARVVIDAAIDRLMAATGTSDGGPGFGLMSRFELSRRRRL